MQESPVEVLKLRFAKGEITYAEYKEMLAALVPQTAPSASAVAPPTPVATQSPFSQAAAPPSSYKDTVYIPPVSRPEHTSPPMWTAAPVAYSSNVLLILLLLAMIPAIFLFPLSLLILIASAVAVYYDAKSLGAGGGQKETMNSLTWSPFSWAALVLLLWIIGMPLYLIRRREIFDQASATEFPVTQGSGGVGKIVVLLIIGVLALMLLLIISAVIAAFVFGMGSSM
ncbi:MAG: hypothetical protein ABFC89_09100 [Methanospirillum sp.]